MKFEKFALRLVLSAVTALLLSGHVHSFELFGNCFGSSCPVVADPEIIDPKTYSIEFVVTGPASEDAESSIKGVSELWRGREKAVGGSAGLISRAKGDYQRILAGLYNEGFYAGSISIEVNGQQAADLKPGTELPENSQVRIEVESGSVYQFGQFTVEGRAPEAADEDDAVEVPRALENQPGDVARAGQVRIAGKLAVEEWRQQGHPKANVSEKDVRAIHREQELNVRIGIDPGPYAVYGETSVEGAQAVDPEFIAYMTDLPPGQEYDPDDVERARKRLDKLDVFTVRKIEEGETVSENGEMPVTVIVKEKKQRRIGVGATLSTTDGAGIETYWLHRNLGGKAERLRLEGEVGGLGNTFRGDELDYRASATFTKPGVFSPDIDWVSRVYATREFNDTFEGETAGGSSVLTHLYSDDITYSTGGFFEYSRFVDAFGTREFVTGGLLGTLTFDSRDSKLDPTNGFYADFEVKPFHEFNFGNTGAKLDAEFRSYLALDDEGDTVIAARVKVGSLVGVSSAEAPTNFLYFAGGGGSVRGFGYNNIGVPLANGAIAGGRSLFETSVELRQRLTESFGVAGFVDAGTVGSDSFINFSEQMRVSAGLGLRYYTGLGPIRLDVAVPLNPQSNDPDFGIFAGIGQAF